MLRKILAHLCFRQARIWLTLGRLGWAPASLLLRLAHVLWPHHPDVLPWLRFLDGIAALQQGQPERALSLLLEAEQRLPPQLGVSTEIGLAHAMAGHYEQAISVLERAICEENAGKRADVWSALAWAYLCTGHATQAFEACLRAAQAKVHSPRLNFLSRLAMGVKIGSLSREEIRQALYRVPEASLLLLEYARKQAQEGRKQLACQAIAAFPEDEQQRAWTILFQASLNEEDCATASWALTQLEQQAATEKAAEMALLQAELALHQNQLQQAIECVQQALGAQPPCARTHEQAARVFLLAGQWEKAVDEAIQALHTSEAGALAAGVAALAALEAGDIESARSLFIAQRRGDGLARAMAYTAQAWLFFKKRSYSQALQLAQWAIREIAGLPAWAAKKTVITRLQKNLQKVLHSLRDGGEEMQRQEAERLLRQLERICLPKDIHNQ